MPHPYRKPRQAREQRREAKLNNGIESEDRDRQDDNKGAGLYGMNRTRTNTSSNRYNFHQSDQTRSEYRDNYSQYRQTQPTSGHRLDINSKEAYLPLTAGSDNSQILLDSAIDNEHTNFNR